MSNRTNGIEPALAADLAELLTLVCSSASEDAQVSSLGAVGPPVKRGYTAHVRPSAWLSFEGIHVRPWTAEEFGELEVDLTAGDRDVASLEAALGPLRTVPRLHGSGHRVQGIFDRPGLPAWAAVFLELDRPPQEAGARITGITIRTEPNLENG
jgi:hypothetical protein